MSEENIVQENTENVEVVAEGTESLPPLPEDAPATQVDEFEDLAELASLMTKPEEREALIQSLLFANGEPLTVERLCEVTFFEQSVVEEALTNLKASLEKLNAGIDLVVVGGAYQLRTKSPFAPFIRGLKASSPRRLSQQALETLAIIAYRQPIVKSDVERIRGVDATPTIKTLLERRLIKIAGHQATPGQPALYGTTDEFLKLFGLSSLGELPTLRDLKEMDVASESGQDKEAPAPESADAPVEAVQPEPQ
jgi:segregation and condensation protein B